MPRAPRRCSRCDEIVPCAAHPNRDYRAEAVAYGNRHSRGYGNEHEERAKALRAASRRSDAPCSICGKRIDYSLRKPHPRSFAAHHLTNDKSGPLAPAHKRCNEQAGAPGLK